MFTQSNPPVPAPVVGVRLPHFRLEIVSAAAKHPAATGKRRRQRFILPKVIIGDLGHIEEQARLEGNAPVLVEFPEDIDIEQLTHEEEIGFSAPLLQSRRTFKRTHNETKTSKVIGVCVFRRGVDRILIEPSDLERSNIELTPGRRSDCHRKKDQQHRT